MRLVAGRLHNGDGDARKPEKLVFSYRAKKEPAAQKLFIIKLIRDKELTLSSKILQYKHLP